MRTVHPFHEETTGDMSASTAVRGKRISRRRFLGGLGIAGTALALPAGARADVPAMPGASSGKTPTVYATLYDLDRCVGCGACVEACHERNGARYPEPIKPFPDLVPAGTKNEDWSDRRDVDDRLTPYNWLYIQSATVDTPEGPREMHVPRRCLHCANPPCANLCPWGSARRETSGAVSIEASTCLGGAKCRTVCPWHIPQRQSGVGLYLDLMPRFAGNGVMYKCDRCADITARGGIPACIEACPYDVQTIGPRDAIIAEAKRLAAERGWHLYGLDDNGGTNTIYLSPVPFGLLDAAIPKGPGRPHLAPVADAMRDETRLAAVAATAPLAGFGAAMLRVAADIREAAHSDAPGAHSSHAMGKPGRAAPHRLSAPTAIDTITPHAFLHPATSRAVRAIWLACAIVLGFTGLMQMPIAARYGMTALPGLAWTGDFHVTHRMHYVFAALLLGLGGWLLGRALRQRAFPALTREGWLRLGLVAGLAGTGVLRVLKNLPDVSFSPLLTLWIDLAHLGLAVALGAVALVFAFTGRAAWTRPRPPAGRPPA